MEDEDEPGGETPGRGVLRAGEVRPATYDAESLTVDVRFYSGAAVDRVGSSGPYKLAFAVEGMDLSRLNGGAGVFVEHMDYADTFSQVGVVESAWIEAGAAYARIRFAADEAAAVHRDRVADGIVRHVSMGVEMHAREETVDEAGTRVVTVTHATPFEISLVGTPADPRAEFLSAATAGSVRNGVTFSRPSTKGNPMETEEEKQARLAREAKDKAEREAREAALAAERDAALEAAEAAKAESVRLAAERDAAAAETERLGREREVNEAVTAFGFEPSVAATLNAEGIDVNAARERLQRMSAERAAATAPRGHTGVVETRGAERRAAMTSALAHRCDPSVDLAAGARDFRGMTLSQMARASLDHAGVSTTGMTADEIAREVLSAAHTTGDFPLVLGGALDQSLRAAYQIPDVVYPMIARQTTLTNFRAHTRIALGDMPLPKPISENAAIRYGTFGEEGNSIKLQERALMIAISRQMIVNDDLQAFADLPRMLGIGIRSLEEQLVIGVLNDNAALSDGSALFSTAHGNIASAGTKIDEAAVSEGRRVMRSQVGVGDKAKGDEPRLISAPPKILLTGPANQTDAEKLVAGITPATTGNVNVFSGRLSVATTDYLTTSPEPWFMFADPNVAPVLEYGYLDGQAGPQIESRPGWNTTGLEFRILHDFAAAGIDHRGAYRNTGSNG